MPPFPRTACAGILALLVSMGTPAGAQAVDDVVTIVVTGDTGLNRSRQKVNAKGVHRGGFQSWAQTLSGIAAQIDGDLNFMNMESVVTDRNDLPIDTKGQRGPFNFRSHPQGVRHLVRAGFNLVSLANNHSMDYSVQGLRQTLKHMKSMKKDGLLAHAGIGMNREEAGRPKAVTVKGAKVQFAAIGIVTNNLARHRAGPRKPGQIAYRFDEDFIEVTRRLAAAKGDYRILSVHYGYERHVRTDAMQIRDWRGKAVRGKGIDLIIGHHAHVVRGVEVNGDAIIFYGLGNFLHHGTADMAKHGICRDYGLMARIHLTKDGDGHLRPRAIEALPVTDMHYRTRPFASAREAHLRLAALNHLAGQLDNAKAGAKGVRFTPQKNGSGLYCFPGAAREPGRIGALCRNWRPAATTSAAVKRRVAASCGSVKKAKRKKARRKTGARPIKWQAFAAN